MLYGYGKRIIYRISLFVKEQKNKDNRVKAKWIVKNKIQKIDFILLMLLMALSSFIGIAGMNKTVHAQKYY